MREADLALGDAALPSYPPRGVRRRSTPALDACDLVLGPGGLVMSSADLPLLLLAVAAPLGAFDVAYYHLYRFRLFARPESWGETTTHLVRGLLISGGAWGLAHHEAHGLWVWVFAGLFALDFLNNLVDVALEPRSRASLGGLPPLEYAIHVAGASLSGAVAAAFVAVNLDHAGAATALVAQPSVSSWLRLDTELVAVGGLLLTLLEGALLLRAMIGQARSGAPASLAVLPPSAP